MRKIVFGGICMFVSVIGIFAMILAALNGSKIYGSINGDSDMLTYLNRYGMAPIFSVFCLVGILGFCIGLWGTFDKNSSKQ